MKPFECSVTIDAPRSSVIELWQDVDKLKYWQDGFVCVEHLEGNQGEVGASMAMKYMVMNGKKEITLIETVMLNELPAEFKGSYAGDSMTNIMHSRFEENDGATKWTALIHYTDMKGLLIKIMTFLMPGVFKKQVQKWMDQFKTFAEAELSVVIEEVEQA